MSSDAMRPTELMMKWHGDGDGGGGVFEQKLSCFLIPFMS